MMHPAPHFHNHIRLNRAASIGLVAALLLSFLLPFRASASGDPDFVATKSNSVSGSSIIAWIQLPSATGCWKNT